MDKGVADYVELSIVVPAFQEGDSLYEAVERIIHWTRRATSAFEVVVIDDGSADMTWQCIQRLCTLHHEVRGVRFSRNFGKDAAISAGISRARGEAALIIDADLQHPPEIIPEFYRLWKQGYDVVEGVKQDRRDEPFLRRVSSRLFNALARRATHLDLRNSTDFKLISRDALQAWTEMRECRLFFRGMVEWLGFRRARVSFDVAPSIRGGGSTWPVSKLLGLSLRAIVSYSTAPLRIAHFIALTFITFGVLLGIQTLWMWASGRAVGGFTTVIVLLLLQGGLILGVLAVISEYVAAIYEESKARPRFVVSETANIGAVVPRAAHGRREAM